MNAMYCGEQIQVPEDLGAILKQFTKAAIRDSPSEDAVLKWAANYFAVLANQAPPFDQTGRLMSEGGGRKARTGASSAPSGDMVTDVMEGAGGFEAVDGGAGGATDEEATEAALHQIFAHYDVDGSGRLERAELPALFADIKSSLGIDFTEDQISEVISILDTDADGTISLQEFRQLIA
jgi:hypothetical protein